VPVISRFLGIAITMVYNDHLPPHFHANYGEFEISVRISNGAVEGQFPPRSLRHVLEWRKLHASELMENWTRAHAGQPLNAIAPLE